MPSGVAYIARSPKKCAQFAGGHAGPPLRDANCLTRPQFREESWGRNCRQKDLPRITHELHERQYF